VMLLPRFQNLPPVRTEPPRATANVIKRKATADPPTKRIELAKLEQQIALSTAPTHDSPTKKIDIGGVLPRVPPGADEWADLEDRDTDSIVILPKRSRKPKPVEPAARPTPPPVPPAAPIAAAQPVVTSVPPRFTPPPSVQPRPALPPAPPPVQPPAPIAAAQPPVVAPPPVVETLPAPPPPVVEPLAVPTPAPSPVV